MESSWRSNVWEKGLGYTGATLAASVHGTGGVAWITNQPAPPGFVWWWDVPSDTSDLAYNLEERHGAVGFSFPYGIAVDPDVPM